MSAVDINHLKIRLVTFTAKCLSEHIITQVSTFFEIVLLNFPRAFNIGADLAVYAHP